jgi:hypothetical protein
MGFPGTFRGFTVLLWALKLLPMAAQQRMAIWAAEEIDEDLQDVDLVLSIGNYPQNDVYDDGSSRSHPRALWVLTVSL